MLVWRIFLLTCSIACGQTWQMQESGTAASLRGISAVGDRVAWASGSKGTILRTIDGGATWQNVNPAGVADLDFRDIEAINDRVAFAMAAGEGRSSRIYKTTDGGATWAMLRANGAQGFWDSFAMWDATHGVLMGDPVDGRFTILHTTDGLNWNVIEGPKAEKGEAAFAASGTALVTRGTREAWFATGGPSGGRVFHSDDAGKTWTAARTPLKPANDGAGIFSLAFAGPRAIAVGGDYTKANETAGNIAIWDGSKWAVPAGSPRGYRSAVARIGDQWITVGTSGSDISTDGQTWRGFDDGAFNALSVAGNICWAVGPNGRIARLVMSLL
jgi:photosystem II stability/assembly factor-like uncharacterized protein